MSRISVLSRPKREWLMALFLVASVLLLAACGGGGGGGPTQATLPPPGDTTPTQPTTPAITGVATPSSVAVVTATNAQ